MALVFHPLHPGFGAELRGPHAAAITTVRTS
jgi:hypothetical protein